MKPEFSPRQKLIMSKLRLVASRYFYGTCDKNSLSAIIEFAEVCGAFSYTDSRMLIKHTVEMCATPKLEYLEFIRRFDEEVSNRFHKEFCADGCRINKCLNCGEVFATMFPDERYCCLECLKEAKE